jgi:hypothetical protein
VLARLDEIPGVTGSRAECSGHYFRVELADGAADGIVPRAIEVLGRGARLLLPDEAAVQEEARRLGEPWLTAQEARALSFVEGRIVGIRVSVTVAREIGLSAHEQMLLAEAVREEMFAHVDRIYAGLARAGRFFEAWPQIAQRAANRVAHRLGRAQSATVASALVGYFQRPYPTADR